MSENFALEVDDALAKKLHERDDVHDQLVLALREVYGEGENDPAAEKQAELQDRMGIEPSDDEGDDSTAEAELADLQREQLKAFLRRERKDGIDKS